MGSCASVMMGEDVRIAKIMSKFELVKPSDAKPGLARVVRWRKDQIDNVIQFYVNLDRLLSNTDQSGNLKKIN